MTATATQQLKQTRAFSCLECGKCTAVCPISQVNESYSPRRLLANAIFYGTEGMLDDRLLWSCLTCGLCSSRCPVDVKYSEYMRDLRAEAYAAGKRGSASHSGVMQSIMEMAAEPGLKQNRTGWITDKLRTRKSGDVLYFVGCLPYYEDIFAKDMEFSPISIAKDTVRVLNHIGIEPVVMANERCCGHDAYWLGQLELFDRLAELNVAAIKATGVSKIVTSCPECATALGKLYEERVGERLQVQHVSEVVAENIGRVDFDDAAGTLTYHDPCRLGRHMGVFDAPRKALGAMPNRSLAEMAHNRAGAGCCGTTNWTNCDATSKQIQANRLKEATATGADTMVTACPKCQIHFRCLLKNQEAGNLQVKDFVSVVASALRSGGGNGGDPGR